MGLNALVFCTSLLGFALKGASAARPGLDSEVSSLLEEGGKASGRGSGDDDDTPKFFEPLDASSIALEKQYDLLMQQRLHVKDAIAHDTSTLKHLEADKSMYKTMQKAVQVQLERLEKGRRDALLDMYDAEIYDFKSGSTDRSDDQETATGSQVFQMPVAIDTDVEDTNNKSEEVTPDEVDDTGTNSSV
mmetsp:Transcript_66618/g.124330  ORF Transcript_66618/g.124330 Transcript_66618/m.124330 type:complete len:189 (+) Transcript_66618:173-739(+)